MTDIQIFLWFIKIKIEEVGKDGCFRYNFFTERGFLTGGQVCSGWSLSNGCVSGGGAKGVELSVVILLTSTLCRKKTEKMSRFTLSSSLDDTSEIAPFSQAVPDQVQYHETPTFAF